MTFTTDGHEYEILQDAISKTINNGLFVEIGTRAGGSTKMIIDGIVDHHENANLVCIDPYGDIGYETSDGVWCKYDYTNDMRKQTHANLTNYVLDKDINLHLLTLTDQEYFHRFHDGYPLYDEFERIESRYSFVYFDGPHSGSAVLNEVMFFHTRCTDEAVLVFDDVCEYDHSMVDHYLKSLYWQEERTGEFKVSYTRMK